MNKSSWRAGIRPWQIHCGVAMCAIAGILVSGCALITPLTESDVPYTTLSDLHGWFEPATQALHLRFVSLNSATVPTGYRLTQERVKNGTRYRFTLRHRFMWENTPRLPEAFKRVQTVDRQFELELTIRIPGFDCARDQFVYYEHGRGYAMNIEAQAQ